MPEAGPTALVRTFCFVKEHRTQQPLCTRALLKPQRFGSRGCKNKASGGSTLAEWVPSVRLAWAPRLTLKGGKRLTSAYRTIGTSRVDAPNRDAAALDSFGTLASLRSSTCSSLRSSTGSKKGTQGDASWGRFCRSRRPWRRLSVPEGQVL